ncbi:hypothetical protein OHA21_09395 [Actinoplanes sp. NBC_00393]|uniref:hypothetical protein n=1 Tax=Actinoplanes sp. NBC_00393 TaxID=2975953 RepID=UPI002E228322
MPNEKPSEQRAGWVAQARAALIIAAMRRTLVTYGELGTALGIEGVALRNHMRHVLDEVARDCATNKEPSLAALVVNQETGQPGAGWQDGSVPWHTEVRAVFRHWPPK